MTGCGADGQFLIAIIKGHGLPRIDLLQQSENVRYPQEDPF